MKDTPVLISVKRMIDIMNDIETLARYVFKDSYLCIIVRQRDQGIYGLFRNLRALGCSVPSAARALLRARRFLNRP